MPQGNQSSLIFDIERFAAVRSRCPQGGVVKRSTFSFVVCLEAVLTIPIAGCGGSNSGSQTQFPISVSLGLSTNSVAAGGTVQVTATVTNDTANKGVTWTVSCASMSCGSVSPAMTASGVAATYTAPASSFSCCSDWSRLRPLRRLPVQPPPPRLSLLVPRSNQQ